MASKEQNNAQLGCPQKLATNNIITLIRVVISPVCNYPAMIMTTAMAISSTTRRKNSFFPFVSVIPSIPRYDTIQKVIIQIYKQINIKKINHIIPFPFTKKTIFFITNLSSQFYCLYIYNQIVEIQKNKMGNQCGLCDANNVSTKNQLRTLEHTQIPDNTSPLTNERGKQLGLFSRQNTKYFGEQRTQNNYNTEQRRVGTPLSDNKNSEKKRQVQLKSGIKYEGQWVGGEKHGLGTQVWPDGAKYQGYWYQGKATGKGVFTHVHGDTYNGQWKDDKAHGYGVYVHAKTGAKYEGYWQNDMQHGSGIEVYQDGNRYEGMFKQGKRNGEGVYYLFDGTIYKGQWINGRIQGKGICEWKDGRRYQGSWLDNKKHGFGVYTWPDGRRYEGQYKNDKKHGMGTYSWADGRKHVGEWKNDKRHGRGQYIVNEHNIKQGLWQEDKRIKWLNQKQDN